jgi:hypothetical protein
VPLAPPNFFDLARLSACPAAVKWDTVFLTVCVRGLGAMPLRNLEGKEIKEVSWVPVMTSSQ